MAVAGENQEKEFRMTRSTLDSAGRNLMAHSMRQVSSSFTAAVVLTVVPVMSAQSQERPGPEAVPDHAVVIHAEDYAFDAPDELPSGWTTLRFVNDGEEGHLLMLTRLPGGRTLQDYEMEVVSQFDEAWQEVRSGGLEVEAAPAKIMAGLPDWYRDASLMGGSGILSEGRSSDVTLRLEPGTYVLECYMKTQEGEFHAVEGMIRELTVTQDGSGSEPPDPDVRVTLSNFDMDVDGELRPGRQIVEVHVAEHPEEGFGHNVHVLRDPTVGIDEIVRWLYYLEPEGLRPPAPGIFAGGMHILPEEGTGYFAVDLEPGRYLFVSETTGSRGVHTEVHVGDVVTVERP